jgi:hypothetical protein
MASLQSGSDNRTPVSTNAQAIRPGGGRVRMGIKPNACYSADREAKGREADIPAPFDYRK